jgi:hypothetical protein
MYPKFVFSVIEKSVYLPENLNDAERDRGRGELVIKELHPDRRPSELPVKLFAVVHFLSKHKTLQMV